MKKSKRILIAVVFTVLSLCICAAPFFGMTFARTDSTPENRSLAAFPSIKTKEGKFNLDVMSDLGNYFEDHFAFRNPIVAADGYIQSAFGVCASDSVIKGTNGWLYYSSSMPDFQRLSTMSDKEIRNAVHNLDLTREYLAARNIRFIVTVAPNKNSLYPEAVPYYILPGKGRSNAERFAEALKNTSVTYADLFSAFRAKDEILYLKRDSHWNEKGALMAYDILLSAAEKPHETYADVSVLRTKSAVGDLGKMAYSVAAPAEWNYAYDIPFTYTFTSKTTDVEDPFLTTENPEGTGSLLMFRDSFGNTLLPYFAQNYASAAFSKVAPYTIEKYIAELHPDTVIIEKVERNLIDFAEKPPVFAAQKVQIKSDGAISGSFTFSVGACPADPQLIEVKGTVNSDADIEAVYFKTGKKVYSAFTVSDQASNDFLLYLPKGTTLSEEIGLFIGTDGQTFLLQKTGGDEK